jgi:beta-galactosidase GanA
MRKFAIVAGASLAAVVASTSSVSCGVDYYPEQWDLADMAGDLASIRHDLKADVIRIGEFMWHHVEPADNVFNFTLLDAIIDAAEGVGLKVMLGTPTATMPAWLYVLPSFYYYNSG